MLQLLKKIVINACLILITMNSGLLSAQLENTKDIFAESILFAQHVEPDALFKSVPTWEPKVIKELFAVYLQKLTTLKTKTAEEVAIYNARFINAHWGPWQNPFNKYPRPAKIFVFPTNKNKIFYTAPLVQNAKNLQYYIFDLTQAQPLLLHDWLQLISRREHIKVPLRINICDKYAILPTDSCSKSTYVDEVRATSATNSALLTEPVPSALRDPNIDWRVIAHTKLYSTQSLEDSIYNSAISWNDLKARETVFKKITIWPNNISLQTNFSHIRDTRFFPDDVKSDFLRRLSWLYPDDGCWTRAAAAIKAFFGTYKEPNPVNNFSRPARIFAFGNLCVNTQHSPNGNVMWWYHVAPIVKDGQTGHAYVLDPAVEAARPLLVTDWIARISAHDGACADARNIHVETINICNGYGVGPNDRCEGSPLTREASESLGQQYYLKAERERQILLGRDPDQVLGEKPPWL